jgi:hypothetical protein
MNSGKFDERGPGGKSAYLLGPNTIELCEPAAISWSIVNSGNSDRSKFVASVLAKATEDVVNDYMKNALKASGAAVSPLGSLAGALFAALLDSALNFIFTDCDGIVDVGALSYPIGRELQKAVLGSQGWELTVFNSWCSAI